MKPPPGSNPTVEQRVRNMEEYEKRLTDWAVALSRSLSAYTKQMDDLFNRGSIKRLEQ